MGNACSNDENRTGVKQDDIVGTLPALTDQKNAMRTAGHKEEGEKMQSPDEKHQEINDKYSNNLTPIDELPEITNPNVRMSIDKHGSYVHQSNLQESMIEEVDLKQKVKFRFNNSHFDGEVVFPDQEALKMYQEHGHVEIDSITAAIGTKVFSDDSRYEGDFQRGKFNGTGRFIHANGDMYEGEFVDNMAEGYGKFQSQDGSVFYEGMFEKNLPHGKGIKVSNEKEKYEGDFTCGKKDGYGIQNQEGVYTYKGAFKNDTYDGEGEYVYEDATGRSYKGFWENGKYHGQGTYTFQNGDVYQGEYVHGSKQGHGKLQMNEKGVVYEGEWFGGKQHGQGKLYTTADLQELISGTWEMGQYQQDVNAN